jgi:SAM-dependent methyltransferase
MHERDRESAARVAERIASGRHDRAAFRRALKDVPAPARDAWLDHVLGLGGIPEDGPELPRDGVPYLPSSVDSIVRAVDRAGVDASDVFVDVGSGIGRAALAAHLLTGASAVGIDIQPRLVKAARDRALELGLTDVSFVHGDAAEEAPRLTRATVFFLYCPFSGARLAALLGGLEPIARRHPLRLCCVDLPLPAVSWLTAERVDRDLVVYRATPDHA